MIWKDSLLFVSYWRPYLASVNLSGTGKAQLFHVLNLLKTLQLGSHYDVLGWTLIAIWLGIECFLFLTEDTDAFSWTLFGVFTVARSLNGRVLTMKIFWRRVVIFCEEISDKLAILRNVSCFAGTCLGDEVWCKIDLVGLSEFGFRLLRRCFCWGIKLKLVEKFRATGSWSGLSFERQGFFFTLSKIILMPTQFSQIISRWAASWAFFH